MKFSFDNLSMKRTIYFTSLYILLIELNLNAWLNYSILNLFHLALFQKLVGIPFVFILSIPLMHLSYKIMKGERV